MLRNSSATRTLRKAHLSMTTSRSRGKMLVLSDVDGTLVKGSLVLDHAHWLDSEGIIDLQGLAQAWKHDQKNEEIINQLGGAYQQSIVGMTTKDIRAAEYMNMVFSMDDKFYSVLDRLKHARKTGHDVILVSGSPQFLVGNFARRFGFKAIGSVYHRNRQQQFNGRVTGMFHAEAKQRFVDSLDLSAYDFVAAYGDTASDKPLLSVAHHAALVAPTQETLEKYQTVHEVFSE